jgi:hypothetical protein
MAQFDTLSLNTLLLDSENPRHDVIEDQKEIVRWMMNSIGDKVYHLAQHIAKHGISPLERTMVMPLNGKKKGHYMVLEGNRRVTALKLLHEPELCPTSRDRTRFAALASTAVGLPDEISVAIVTSRDEADPWILVRHQGEQGGAGTVQWGPAAAERYSSRMNRQGQDAYAVQVLDYATQTELVAQEVIDNVPTTNLSRLLRDPYVRERLGLSVNPAGMMSGLLEQKELDKALAYILQELGTKAITVDRVRHKDNRRSYIEDVIKTASVDTSRLESERYDLAAVAAQAKKPSKRKKRDNAPSIARPTLIPADFRMKIDDTRLNSIYKELKGLNVEDYTNAVSVTFRLFLEAMVKTYLKNTDPKWSPSAKSNEELFKQVRRVANELKAADKLTEDQAKPALTACENPDSFFSIKTFNSYVHNLHMHPMAGDLKRAWDNFQPFIHALEEYV